MKQCAGERDTEVKMVVLLSHADIVQALEQVEQDKTAMLVRLMRLTKFSVMVCKKLSKESEYFFLTSQVNDIPKVTLNLRSLSPV